MRSNLLAVLVLNFAFISFVSAEPGAARKNKGSETAGATASVKMITPIFSQLVRIPVPKGFTPVFENAAGGQYILEWVPRGETTQRWSQMITLTGMKGLAADPKATPEKLAEFIASNFRRVCPDSFSNMAMGVVQISGYDAFISAMSCGVASPKGEPYSESLLLLTIKGERDYYTLQWAERGAASKAPIKPDMKILAERIKVLSPIKLCPVIPGEPAPYPSCVSRE